MPNPPLSRSSASFCVAHLPKATARNDLDAPPDVQKVEIVGGRAHGCISEADESRRRLGGRELAPEGLRLGALVDDGIGAHLHIGIGGIRKLNRTEKSMQRLGTVWHQAMEFPQPHSAFCLTDVPLKYAVLWAFPH